ncbi:MAG: flagellar biosynthetic protein FliR [Acetobacteraceae bacterium]
MNPADAELIAALPTLAFGLILVMARVGGAVALLPGLGEPEPPVLLRVGLTLGITALVLPGVAALIPPVPEAGLLAALMVAAEVLTGLWLGWLARLLVLALPVAGQFIGYMMGIANVLQPDPILGGQATPIARAFAVAAPLIILVTGLYGLPLAALAGSYALVPAGTLLPAADTVETAVHAVSTSFALAVRLASPFMLVAIVWNVAIGLLARLVPRLQVYFVAMPGQILGGMVLLAVLSSALVGAWLLGLREGFGSLPGL